MVTTASPSAQTCGSSGLSRFAFVRRFGDLIWRVGVDLGMHTVTIASAALYFQRFFLAEAEGRFNATRIATACVWLASKAREDGHRLRDIANAFQAIRGNEDKGMILQMEEYWALRDEVVAHEQAVLRAMAFDAEPTPAYAFLTEFVWLLNCESKERGVASLAWTVLNDAFCSEVCALWPPARVALACVLLAVELGKRHPQLRAEAEKVASAFNRLSREPKLEEFLGIGPDSGADELEEICRDLLSVYETDRTCRHAVNRAAEAGL
mmetsp:Transcript_81167/g.225903  ORF Transcript_81167/g.225903 Transcript_81167/m.225903 type:complete len:266 (+) Transcript_81167:78-875(+)